MDAKADTITIYEHAGVDLADLTAEFADRFGLPDALAQAAVRRMQERESTHGQFAPILRFTLADKEARLFKAQRMRFTGAGGWINVDFDKPVGELAATLIPTLGTDKFFTWF